PRCWRRRASFRRRRCTSRRRSPTIPATRARARCWPGSMASRTDKRRPTRAEKQASRAVVESRDPVAAELGGPAPQPATRTRMSPAGRVAAALLLALFAVQAIWAAGRDSVTIDEFIHLPIGLHALTTGDLREDPINSHLPRMFAALPVLAGTAVFQP